MSSFEEPGPTLLCTHDLQGTILAANSAAARILEIEQSALPGRNLRELLAPNFRGDFERYLETLLRDGIAQGEMRVVTASGRERTWRYSNRVGRDSAAGTVVYGWAVDLSGMRSTVRAAKRNRVLLETILQNVPILLLSFDSGGRIELCEGAGLETLGWEPEEVIGDSVFRRFGEVEFFTPEGRTFEGDEALRRVLAGEALTASARISKAFLRFHLFPDPRPGGAPAGAVGVAVDMTENRRAFESLRAGEEKLRASREQLRSLAARLQAVREEERTMVAREIHDELGQALTAMRMDLSWLERKLSGARSSASRELLRAKVSATSDLMLEAIETVRRIASRLRPGVLDDLGLLPAISWQADEFSRRTGIPCAVRAGMADVALEPDCSTALFRVLQEALTNVVRHSAAKTVSVEVRETEGEVEMTVIDDGRGIRTEEISDRRSLGVLGMRERIVGLGGSFAIGPLPGSGTRVRVRFPKRDSGRGAAQ